MNTNTDVELAFDRARAMDRTERDEWTRTELARAERMSDALAAAAPGVTGR